MLLALLLLLFATLPLSCCRSFHYAPPISLQPPALRTPCNVLLSAQPALAQGAAGGGAVFSLPGQSAFWVAGKCAGESSVQSAALHMSAGKCSARAGHQWGSTVRHRDLAASNPVEATVSGSADWQACFSLPCLSVQESVQALAHMAAST